MLAANIGAGSTVGRTVEFRKRTEIGEQRAAQAEFARQPRRESEFRRIRIEHVAAERVAGGAVAGGVSVAGAAGTSAPGAEVAIACSGNSSIQPG